LEGLRKGVVVVVVKNGEGKEAFRGDVSINERDWIS
jgi:hypothetical protein